MNIVKRPVQVQWYDVCNDYSLSLLGYEPDGLDKYTPKRGKYQGIPCTLWFHTEYDELHYMSFEYPNTPLK